MDNWKREELVCRATQAVYDGEEVTIQAGFNTFYLELLPGLKRMNR
jgi:hypothetical protein